MKKAWTFLVCRVLRLHRKQIERSWTSTDGYQMATLKCARCEARYLRRGWMPAEVKL